MSRPPKSLGSGLLQSSQAQGALTNVLRVPYFVQPTGITCQSTCLKMMATYLEQSVVRQSTAAAARHIFDIWKDINESSDRPVKMRNAHLNMKWWLERYFPSLTFEYTSTRDEIEALELIVDYIDGSVPVIASVSHARVKGRIILVIGYENYQPMQSTADFRLVVNDPYGRFEPSLLSKMYGKARMNGGASLAMGGEVGPGKECRLFLNDVSRHRKNDAARGQFYLLSARI